jgi:periplasmic protein TonB
MRLGIGHWLLALLAAAALHLMLFIALPQPQQDDGMLGLQGIEISLGRPPAPEPDEPPVQPAPEPTPPAPPEPEVEPEPAPPEPPVERAPKVIEEPPPKPAPEPEKPRQPPEPEPEPPVREQRDVPPAPAPQATPEGRGSAEAGATASDSGIVDSYRARLRAHLEQHKEYPRRAMMRRQEGTVLVRFTVHRDGRIDDVRIVESSGYPLLDEAVRTMLRQAQPAPRFPPEMREDRLELPLPVEFYQR